ncbi:MAG: hypothetical protein R3A13_05865 [Bdellovibrionota bacterium]
MNYIPKKYHVFIQVFLLLLAIVGVGKYQLDTNIIVGLIGLGLGATVLYRFIKLRTFEVDSFARSPELYNKEFIELEGNVVKIFTNTMTERLKRKAVDAWRDKTGNSDSKGRYVHQRFLIKSKDLYPGETLLVEHNENYGRININRGDKVRLKGEYIHPSKLSRHRYGRIHHTHRPSGWIKIFR